jgi:hypothetical protein
MKLTVDIKNTRKAELVKQVLNQFNLKVLVTEKESEKTVRARSRNALKIIKAFPLKKSTISQSIPNPVKWQRKLRRDRKLIRP